RWRAPRPRGRAGCGPGGMADLAPVAAPRRARLGGAARVGRPDVRTCDGRRDPVYRLGTARWRADRSLAPHRATAAACDPGGRVVPGADAVPARGPGVPAGRRRAGTRCGRPDGARGTVV